MMYSNYKGVYEWTQTCPFCNNAKPKEMYLVNVFDRVTGQIKVMEVGERAFEQMINLSRNSSKKRNWFMRILEWLRIIKPLEN